MKKITDLGFLLSICAMILGGSMFLEKLDEISQDRDSWKSKATFQHKLDSCHCVKIIRANSFFVGEEIH
jgi:hypothetical protein